MASSSNNNTTHIGLSVIFEPQSEPIADFVFVHGIQGDPIRTWTATRPSNSNHEQTDDFPRPQKENFFRKLIRGKGKWNISPRGSDSSSQHAGSHYVSSCYWPKDLLPVDLPEARVLTWGYDSKVTKGFKSADKSSLFTHAKNFLFALTRMAVPSRPIIFVAHSLGGIVVKEMLAYCDSLESGRHRNIIASTIAIMFFATPHRGSKDLVDYGEMARRAASVLLLDTNRALLDSLGLRTTDLERSQETFTKLWRQYDFRVKTFQEATGLTAVNLGILNEKVVPDYSSKLDDPREEAESLQGNHRDIVRVTSDSDPNYVAIIGELRLWYNDVCTKPTRPPPANYVDGASEPPSMAPPLHDSESGGTCSPLHEIEREGETPICTGCQAQGKQCICQPVKESANQSIPGLSGPTSTKHHFTKQQKDLIQSLAFNQMRSREKAINQPQRGTCIWLQQNPTFRQWLEDEQSIENHGVLWIRGKPGSGKSTLIKATAQDPRLRSLIVASYYFNGGSTDSIENSELGMYRSLLYQILEREVPYVRDCFFESVSGGPDNVVYNTKDTENWTVPTLKYVLGKLLSESPSPHKPAIFFIDAIDECDGRQVRSILEHLYDLVDMNVLRLCISSRSSFGMIPPKCLVVTMDDYNRSDISSYVTQIFSYSEISTDPRAESLGIDITTRSQGVFLWAVLITHLVVKHHEDGQNWNFIITRLSEVPPELSVLYDQLLADIPATEDALVTYQFFVWVLLSGQSLRMREWYHILPFLQESRPGSLDIMARSKFFIETDMQLERKIRRISRGLVELRHEPENQGFPEDSTTFDTDSVRGDAGSLRDDLGETRSVQIIHGSVAQFFFKGRGFRILILARNKYFTARDGMDSSALRLPLEPPSNNDLADGHYNIMATCLAYLNIHELDDYVDARKLAMRREGKRPEINGRSTRQKSLGRYSPGRNYSGRQPPRTRSPSRHSSGPQSPRKPSPVSKSPARRTPGPRPPESFYTGSDPSQQGGAKRIGPVAPFFSAGSTPLQRYRSAQSSIFMKHVSIDRWGNIIVHEFASGYDRNEPHPTYRSSDGYPRLTSDEMRKYATISSAALKKVAPQDSKEMALRNDILQRYLGCEIDSVSVSSSVSHSPSSLQASSAGHSRKLRIYPALMTYALTELFMHARRAAALGVGPSAALVQQVREMWERYWLLQEDGEVPDLIDFCRDTGLYKWVEALGGEPKPQHIVIGDS